MIKEEAKIEILKVAASLLTVAPSSFIEDYVLPKSTPRAARKIIVDMADQTDVRCKNLAVRLRVAYDILIKK